MCLVSVRRIWTFYQRSAFAPRQEFCSPKKIFGIFKQWQQFLNMGFFGLNNVGERTNLSKLVDDFLIRGMCLVFIIQRVNQRLLGLFIQLRGKSSQQHVMSYNQSAFGDLTIGALKQCKVYFWLFRLKWGNIPFYRKAAITLRRKLPKLRKPKALRLISLILLLIPSTTALVVR